MMSSLETTTTSFISHEVSKTCQKPVKNAKKVRKKVVTRCSTLERREPDVECVSPGETQSCRYPSEEYIQKENNLNAIYLN